MQNNKIKRYVGTIFLGLCIFVSPLTATNNPWNPQEFHSHVAEILGDLSWAIQEHWDVRNYIITLDQAHESACVQGASREIQERFGKFMGLLQNPENFYINEHCEHVHYLPHEIAYIKARFLFTPSEPIPPREMVFPDAERYAFLISNIQCAENLEVLEALADSLKDVHPKDLSFKKAIGQRKQYFYTQHELAMQPPPLDQHFVPVLLPHCSSAHEEIDPSATPDSNQIYRLNTQELSQYMFSGDLAMRKFNSTAISVRIWQLEHATPLSQEELNLIAIMKEVLTQDAIKTQ